MAGSLRRRRPRRRQQWPTLSPSVASPARTSAQRTVQQCRPQYWQEPTWLPREQQEDSSSQPSTCGRGERRTSSDFATGAMNVFLVAALAPVNVNRTQRIPRVVECMEQKGRIGVCELDVRGRCPTGAGPG